MSLGFQNKLIFPAPENSYTVDTSQHQVLYIPRDVLKRAERRQKCNYPTNRKLMMMMQSQNYIEKKKLLAKEKSLMK